MKYATVESFSRCGFGVDFRMWGERVHTSRKDEKGEGDGVEYVAHVGSAVERRQMETEAKECIAVSGVPCLQISRNTAEALFTHLRQARSLSKDRKSGSRTVESVVVCVRYAMCVAVSS